MITIDGPAGTGKSVTAQALAARLGLLYLDSGALYRGVALWAERLGIADPEDSRLAESIAGCNLNAVSRDARFRVRLGEEDVTDALRGEALGQQASRLAVFPVVRDLVAGILRRAAARHACIAEGRDMGSSVFADAGLKIYLTASLAVRAARRLEQLRVLGKPTDADAVRREMEDRDARDQSRTASPLRIPENAVRIDTTRLTQNEQVTLIEELYRGGGWLRSVGLYRVCTTFLRILLIGLLRMRVRGLAHLPHGPMVIACNHRSYFDPPLVGTALPFAIGYLAKDELFHPGWMGAILRRVNAIPVRRGAADRRAIREVLAALQRGMPIVVFPEGTRVKGDQLGTPLPGAAWLARKAKVAVVPACIWSDGFWRGLLRGRILSAHFGTPLRYPPEDGAGDVVRMTDEIMTAIGELRREARKNVEKPAQVDA